MPSTVIDINNNNYIFIQKFICFYKLNKRKYQEIVKKTKDRLGKDNIYKLNSDYTKKKLNWTSKVSLEKGIKETIKFYDIHYKYLLNQSMNFKI